jgi:2-hydroxy-3-keto-5-methylthiopentenyl-1-phosphate phosphatase
MAPLIRAVLYKRIGDDEVASKIEIISNDVQINKDGWEIKYRHPETSVHTPQLLFACLPNNTPLYVH